MKDLTIIALHSNTTLAPVLRTCEQAKMIHTVIPTNEIKHQGMAGINSVLNELFKEIVKKIEVEKGKDFGVNFLADWNLGYSGFNVGTLAYIKHRIDNATGNKDLKYSESSQSATTSELPDLIVVINDGELKSALKNEKIPVKIYTAGAGGSGIPTNEIPKELSFFDGSTISDDQLKASGKNTKIEVEIENHKITNQFGNTNQFCMTLRKPTIAKRSVTSSSGQKDKFLPPEESVSQVNSKLDENILNRKIETEALKAFSKNLKIPGPLFVSKEEIKSEPTSPSEEKGIKTKKPNSI